MVKAHGSNPAGEIKEKKEKEARQNSGCRSGGLGDHTGGTRLGDHLEGGRD